MKLEHYFPYDTPRPHQMETVHKILDAYSVHNFSGYVLEAPTGSGKSGTAYTAAKAILEHIPRDVVLRSGWKGPQIIVCTKDRSLQTQYDSSFIDATKLWSAKNYPCPYSPDDKEFYFGSPLCLKGACRKKGQCGYLAQKNKFMASEVGVLNYHYFLHSRKICPQILILDEAHNIESILCGFMTILISAKTARYVSDIIESYGIEDIDKIEDLAKAILDLDDIMVDSAKMKMEKYFSALGRIHAIIEAKIEKLQRENISFYDLQPYKKLGKVHSILDNLLNRYSHFKNSKVEWVISNHNETSLEIKPLEVYEVVSELSSMFNIFMSATICGFDEFCGTININPFKYDYYSVPTIIPSDNRKVFVTTNTGCLNMNNKGELLPIFTGIMDNFIDQLEANGPVRGIIHSVSYTNAKVIYDVSRHRGRMIIPETSQLMNINNLLRKRENTIIVSPAILEGVDLKDDLSRFQIFPKVPYGNLGDTWIKRKMQKNYSWYQREAALKIVQGSGRSIRSPEDWGVTLILDNNFLKLLKKRNLFPKSFLDSIEYI